MKIPRHNRAIRFTHWVTAFSILVLFFTGFGQMPVYKRYFVDQVPGLGWSSNFLATLDIHYYAAAILVFISFFYITYLLLSKERDILPRRGDFKESLQIFGAMLGLAQEPESDKYLAEQRLAFAVTAFSVLMLIISGLIKVYKNLPGNYLPVKTVFWAAQIHNLFTVILLLSILVHLAAFLLKPNWPLVPSMFTGQISGEYVRQRHGRWWHRLHPGEPADPAGTDPTMVAEPSAVEMEEPIPLGKEEDIDVQPQDQDWSNTARDPGDSPDSAG